MLTSLRTFALFIFSFFIVTTLPCLTSAKPYENYTDFLNEMKNVAIDYQNAYPVTEYFLARDVATISLDSGVIYLCNPINNRRCIAVFIGKGTLLYEPPIKVEQDQLAKDEEKMITNFIEYESNLEKTSFNSSISKTLLEDEYNGVFYSYFDMDDYEDLFFCIDPYEEEEVTLLRGDWYAGFGKYNEDINQFHFMDEYSGGESIDTLKSTNDEIAIEKYTIDCTLDNKLEIKCKAKVDMTAIKKGLIWLPLALYDELEVSSVKSSDGKDLKFYKGKKSPSLWVKLPQEYNVNDSFSINIDYSGVVIKRYGDYVVLKTSIEWYPNYGYREHAFFDLTFHTPDDYEFVCIGDLISESKDDGVYTSHWVMPYKCRNASFNMGIFKRKEFKVEAGSPVEILYQTTQQWKAVAEDVQLSMSFYSKWLGNLPVKKFYATELLGNHGEAFPGMIHLATSAFYDQSKTGWQEGFCSHEVAHQWWGISLDMKSYRDRWLSEGFAEYVSLMYTQMALKDNEKFFKFLIRSRTEIMNLRKSFLGNGFEQGPISLGHRLSSSKTPGDYNLIIYQKGAWILHMLRNICIDLNKLKEDVFLNILKEFYNKYKGSYASTLDFQRIVEKNTGLDYSWFFDQWVNDTKIPTYKVATKSTQTPEGKYQIRMRVKQENVPSTFKMFVPIAIYGKDDKVVRLRTFITNEVSEFDLPLIPFEPDKIKFNEFESVLCDYEEESWD
jgi:hypothetical protein